MVVFMLRMLVLGVCFWLLPLVDAEDAHALSVDVVVAAGVYVAVYPQQHPHSQHEHTRSTFTTQARSASRPPPA